MKRKNILIILLISFIFIFNMCSEGKSDENSPQEDDDGRPSFFVSIAPEKFFVERIGGGLVDVNVVVGEGDDPHTYEPKPRQMKDMSHADIYFSIGIEFEEVWLTKFKDLNKNMKVVQLDKNIEKLMMASHHHYHNGEEHNHDEHNGEEHEEGRPDPHVWLSTRNARIIADEILQTLTKENPKNAETYKKNHEILIKDITALEDDIREILVNIPNREFIVFHPAWGYFARDFNLEQIPVEIEGKEPSPKELAELIRYAKERNIRVVFVSPQFSRKSAETIAKNINGETISIDPLSEDWMENMKKVAGKFKSVMGE